MTIGEATWGRVAVLEHILQRSRVAQWLEHAVFSHPVAGSIPGDRGKFFLCPVVSSLRIMGDSRSINWRIGLVVVWLQCLHVVRGS